MPQTQPSLPPELDDLPPAHEDDGYVEVQSVGALLGNGVLVVTPAAAAELIATGNWAAYP